MKSKIDEPDPPPVSPHVDGRGWTTIDGELFLTNLRNTES